MHTSSYSTCIFLHFVAREAELRQLRKSSTDYELQNASLSRIVESMRTAVDSLESDINTQRASNLALSRHLDQLRASLAAAFHAVPLPGKKNTIVFIIYEFMFAILAPNLRFDN